jgi:cell wall-associated NlpC family hydrolase
LINQLIINEARSWLGTRFHHQGRVKANGKDRGGCDCIGLVIGVADNVGLKYQGKKFSEYDQTNYAKIPDGVHLYKSFCQYLEAIRIDQVQSGDVMMFKFNKAPQHVGIIGELNGDLSIIHCYLQARGVVEHRLDDYWRGLAVAGFRWRSE